MCQTAGRGDYDDVRSCAAAASVSLSLSPRSVETPRPSDHPCLRAGATSIWAPHLTHSARIRAGRQPAALRGVQGSSFPPLPAPPRDLLHRDKASTLYPPPSMALVARGAASCPACAGALRVPGRGAGHACLCGGKSYRDMDCSIVMRWSNLLLCYCCSPAVDVASSLACAVFARVTTWPAGYFARKHRTALQLGSPSP